MFMASSVRKEWMCAKEGRSLQSLFQQLSISSYKPCGHTAGRDRCTWSREREGVSETVSMFFLWVNKCQQTHIPVCPGLWKTPLRCQWPVHRSCDCTAAPDTHSASPIASRRMPTRHSPWWTSPTKKRWVCRTPVLCTLWANKSVYAYGMLFMWLLYPVGSKKKKTMIKLYLQFVTLCMWAPLFR